jgi:hypothetical protein
MTVAAVDSSVPRLPPKVLFPVTPASKPDGFLASQARATPAQQIAIGKT